jgi:hypothetical protein
MLVSRITPLVSPTYGRLVSQLKAAGDIIEFAGVSSVLRLRPLMTARCEAFYFKALAPSID